MIYEIGSCDSTGDIFSRQKRTDSNIVSYRLLFDSLSLSLSQNETIVVTTSTAKMSLADKFKVRANDADANREEPTVTNGCSLSEIRVSSDVEKESMYGQATSPVAA